MKQAYDALLLEHSNLKREVNVVTQRNNQLQIEVDSLKQLVMNVPFLGGNGVETSIRKDVAGDKAHRNTKKNIACSFANSYLSV
jgi:regulator of replication initiation timing